MAYQSNLMGDFWRGYKQKRIGTGMPLSQNEMTGLMSPMLNYDAQRADAYNLREQQASEFNRRMSLAEQAQKDQANANKVSGATQLAMLPMAYQSAKGLGWVGGGTAPAAASAPTVAPNLMSAPTVGAATAQGAVGATGTVGGAQQLAGAAYPGIAGGTATPAAVGEMSAVGAGEAAGTGLLGIAGTVAGPAALGAGLGMLGMNKLMGVGGPGHQGGEVHTANISGGIVGGAIAGAAATSWSGPGAIVGGIIGGIIGGISSLF
jgi:hypothetical protein